LLVDLGLDGFYGPTNPDIQCAHKNSS
jgi:hypothetical protein